eukprot:m.12692 g.12692  ORF g.12692 m.12692 type:complete len:491 (-) comp4713_c0_seq2:19-1491(-)
MSVPLLILLSLLLSLEASAIRLDISQVSSSGMLLNAILPASDKLFENDTISFWRQIDIQSRQGEWIIVGYRNIQSESKTVALWSTGLLGNKSYTHRACLCDAMGCNTTCSHSIENMTLCADASPRGKIITMANSTYPRIGEGTMIELKDTLFLFLSRQSQQADLGASKITLQKSLDFGVTWSNPVVIPPSTSAPSRANPGAATINDTTILLTYFVGTTFPNGSKTSKRIYRFSYNSGETWSPEVDMTDNSAIYMTGAHDRLRKLSNGRLLQPVHCKSGNGHSPLFTWVFVSDNNGISWSKHGVDSHTPLNVTGIPADSGIEQGYKCAETGFWESALAETGDPGHVVHYGRTCTGWLYVTHSTDYGDTWSAPIKSDIRHSVSPPNILFVSSKSSQNGKAFLILITIPHFTGTGQFLGSRFVLSSQVSYDYGATWVNYKHIEYIRDEDYYFSYCSAFLDSRNNVHLVYRSNEQWKFISPAYQKLPLSFFTQP